MKNVLRIPRYSAFRNILQTLNQASSFQGMLEFVELNLLFPCLAVCCLSEPITVSP